MDLEQIWEKKKLAAENGRRFWISFLQEHSVGEKDGIMVLFEEDETAAEYLFEHGSELVAAGKFQHIYILTASGKIMNRIRELDRKKPVQEETFKWYKESVLCTKEQIDALILLYQLYKFTGQIIWGTLKNIEDADGYQLEGYHGITKEELIRTAIMDLS